MLYIPPVRTKEELDQLRPQRMHKDEVSFAWRCTVTNVLQETNSLLRAVLQELPVFAETLKDQQELAYLDGDETVEEQEIPMDERIKRMSGLVSQAVFSLSELGFSQLMKSVQQKTGGNT